MDSSVYRLLFGQITNSSVIYHHNIPGHNLLSPETLFKVSKDLNNDESDGGDFLTTFPCYQQFPYSVRMSFPLFCGSGFTDHARELVERKLNWEIKLKKLRVSNTKRAVERIKKLQQSKAVKLSVGLKKYITHFHNDPEPMFSGDYNWLYTGGCLSYDDSWNGKVLISGDYLSRRPGFYLLELNETLDGVKHKSFTSLKSYSPVLQIKCKGLQENLIVCIRQKNNLSLFDLKKENCNEPVKIWRKKVLNTKLLTCVDLKDDCKEVAVTDTNLDVHVFNVERKNKISSFSGKKIGKRSWNQVAFGDESIYWAFRNCFAVFDARDLYSGVKLQYDPTTVGEQCEEICSFIPSSCDSNFIYLGTTHSVLQMDLRNGKTVQKWTHMMKSSPQFMTNIKDGENDFLILQSQAVGETSGIVNECIKDEENVFLSRSLPCLLSSVRESLNLAQLQGVCLNPFFGKRINYAVTGMQCLKTEREIVLLTKNSGGDIFLSKIGRKTSDEVDDSEVVERMRIYESHFETFPPDFKRSNDMELLDMSHLGSNTAEGISQPEVKIKREKPECWWKYNEVYSPESLRYCRDILAGKILAVWGQGLEESDGEEDMSVDRKVREWMERC